MDVKELKSDQKDNFEKLLAYHKLSLKGGELLEYREHEDELGEAFATALIEYGIKGTKKLSASMRQLEVFSGEKDPRLEDLNEMALRVIASEHGLTFDGKPSKTKMIVAIRQQMARQENIDAQVEKLAAERFAEMEQELLRSHGLEPKVSAEESEEEVAYRRMKIDDLRKLANAREIDIPNGAKKDDLISLLLEAQQ